MLLSSLTRYGASLASPSSPLVAHPKYLHRVARRPAKAPVKPPSKKKMYRVPQFGWANPGDIADLLWRRQVYNSAMLSMRRIFREEYAMQMRRGTGFELVKREAEDELKGLLEENDRRNARYAEERSEREKVAMEKLEEETLAEIEHRLDRDASNVERKTMEVLDSIERSKTHFVTRENVDEKVLNALENPITFNYAIDLSGTAIPNSKPTKYLSKVGSGRRMYDQAPGFRLINSTIQPPIPGYAYSGNIDRRNRSVNQKQNRRIMQLQTLSDSDIEKPSGPDEKKRENGDDDERS